MASAAQATLSNEHCISLLTYARVDVLLRAVASFCQIDGLPRSIPGSSRDKCMAKAVVRSKLPVITASALQKLSRQSALAAGENAEAYDAILSGVMAALDPQDTIESFFIRDVVDCKWEITRLQKIQSVLFSEVSSEARSPRKK